MDFLNFGKKKEGKVNRFNIFSRVKESKRKRKRKIVFRVSETIKVGEEFFFRFFGYFGSFLFFYFYYFLPGQKLLRR